MDCGADDTRCQLLSWLFHDNEFATAVLAKWLGQTGVLGAISDFLRDHGEKLIGLAGFSFGLYRWWKYRETMLHRRLEEYLRENDRRLLDGQTYVLEALQRPGPGQKFKLPLFASTALQSVLREQNWDRTFVAANVMSSADWQLSGAMDSIGRQLKTAESTIGSLRQQMATAQILRGAIASAAARGSAADTADQNMLALTAFRSALSVPGQAQNIVAKEYEAHQLRKLGHLNEALDAYSAIEQLAAHELNERSRELAVARAKRYQAEMRQGLASAYNSDGTRRFNFSLVAYGLLCSDADSVLKIRARLAPFEKWDLLDQGDIHYLVALIAATRGGWPNVEWEHLTAAENAYRQILARPIRRFSRARRSNLLLRRQATAGLARVQQARTGVFDHSWLP